MESGGRQPYHHFKKVRGEVRSQESGGKFSLSPSLPIFLSPAIQFLQFHSLSLIKLMQVEFREFNPFDLWIWLKFSNVPSNGEKQYVEEVFDSWFFLGKLGGFNAENLQVQDEGLDISQMNYDVNLADQSMMALMHNMGEMEYQGSWARCWFDLGTSDAIGLDVLINVFQQLSKEFVTIEKLIIGGENTDWPVDTSRRRESFAADN